MRVMTPQGAGVIVDFPVTYRLYPDGRRRRSGLVLVELDDDRGQSFYLAGELTPVDEGGE